MLCSDSFIASQINNCTNRYRKSPKRRDLVIFYLRGIISHMNLSVIIPFWYGAPNKVSMLAECISSLGDEPDEILVIGNTNEGLPWTLNKGLRAASGDFIL